MSRPRVARLRAVLPAWLQAGLKWIVIAGEILASYVRVRWTLWRVAGVSEAMVRLRRAAPRSVTPAGLRREHWRSRSLGDSVSRVLAVLPTDSRCLMRSLVLTRMLDRRRISSVLVIGVRPGADFGAHAWVEHGGEPVLPAFEGEYQRLLEL